MRKFNLLPALFICCLSEDLIQYYNPLNFLLANFPKAKSEFIMSQMHSYIQNKESYIQHWKQKLNAEEKETVVLLLAELEPMVKSYASQMEFPGFVRDILFKFEQHFGALK